VANVLNFFIFSMCVLSIKLAEHKICLDYKGFGDKMKNLEGKISSSSCLNYFSSEER